MTIALAIVGTTARFPMAHRLAAQVGGQEFLDDGLYGEQVNHQRALAWLANQPTRFGIALEEDAIPAPDFHARALADLEAAPPRHLVSGYLGTGRGAGINPARWPAYIDGLLTKADEAGARYVTSRSVWHAVCIAIPTAVIPDALHHLRGHAWLPTDEGLTSWVRTAGWHVAYPVASSWVDHADGPTVTRHLDRQPRTQARHAIRFHSRQEETA